MRRTAEASMRGQKPEIPRPTWFASTSGRVSFSPESFVLLIVRAHPQDHVQAH
jgi:hypothetical protein